MRISRAKPIPITHSPKNEHMSLGLKNTIPVLTSPKFNEEEEATPNSRLVLKLRADLETRTRSKDLAQALGVSEITAMLLQSRGILDEKAARDFLSPTLKDSLPRPDLIKNSQPAARLLLDYVSSKEPITIFSDFDVDGVSSGSVLFLFLKELGANVRRYTPNRFSEGYGLNKVAIANLARTGTKLLVTVDCGTANAPELALAKELGMQTLVIDHHHTESVPPVDVFVNPTQEGCPFARYELAAAGLVWMLLIVIRQEARTRVADGSLSGSIKIPDPKDFLDLAALGTICDMVPLIEVNRTIATRGLEAINRTNRPGLLALIRASGIKCSRGIEAGHVGFNLGPRINAAGRLDDAAHVFELLTTSDSVRAQVIAQSLNKLNAHRRVLEEKMRDAAIAEVLQDTSAQESFANLVFQEDFHLGVIGIVAQRLVETFHKPAAVMAPAEDGKSAKKNAVIKGSVRSIDGFHVAEVLHALSPLLLGGGGHAMAGGFSVEKEKLESFRQAFREEAASRLSRDQLRRVIKADLQVSLSELDYSQVNEIARLAPFGKGNPHPVFYTTKLEIDSVTSISGDHLKLRLSDGRNFAQAVAWGFKGHPLLRKGNEISVAYSPEINSYQGVSSVQLSIKEVWAGDADQ